MRSVLGHIMLFQLLYLPLRGAPRKPKMSPTHGKKVIEVILQQNWIERLGLHSGSRNRRHVAGLTAQRHEVDEVILQGPQHQDLFLLGESRGGGDGAVVLVGHGGVAAEEVDESDEGTL